MNCARRGEWPTGPGCNYRLPADANPAERGWTPWRGGWLCRACTRDDVAAEDNFLLPEGTR